MHPVLLPAPLEDVWRDALDRIARAHRWPTSQDVARLAIGVAKLSATYNDSAADPALARDALPARLLFSFVRDVPKGAAAVREAVATGAIALDPTRPLRVLDLGSGLGAMTWGLARALAKGGTRGTIKATWVEPDRDAGALSLEIARARPPLGREGGVDVDPHLVTEDVRSALGSAGRTGGRYDVIFLGQVLSEMDRKAPGDRAAIHAELVAQWMDVALEPAGSLVIVEPALRDRTRHLHALRDRLLATRSATVFAPCLHQELCPALKQTGDWCHEDLPVNLPAWLIPVARGAGLRWEGLTFSYLVLRKDRRTLHGVLPRGSVRVVSGGFVSKGKTEAFVCGQLQSGPKDGPVAAWLPVEGRVRAMRLERDASVSNERWGDARRGDILLVDPPLDVGRPRIVKETVVQTLGDVLGGVLGEEGRHES